MEVAMSGFLISPDRVKFRSKQGKQWGKQCLLSDAFVCFAFSCHFL